MVSEAAAEHCFSLCSTDHPFQIQTQRTVRTDKPPPSRLQKISSPLTSVSLLVLHLLVPLLDWLPACVAHDFCSPEDPDALGDDSSFFAVTQQQLARLCSQNATLQTGLHIANSSSLDPRLASEAFVVAKDEGRDRFVGDRRPLNSRERSIVRALALLPTTPIHDLWENRRRCR